jgi:hypothetical protein
MRWPLDLPLVRFSRRDEDVCTQQLLVKIQCFSNIVTDTVLFRIHQQAPFAKLLQSFRMNTSPRTTSRCGMSFRSATTTL